MKTRILKWLLRRCTPAEVKAMIVECVKGYHLHKNGKGKKGETDVEQTEVA